MKNSERNNGKSSGTVRKNKTVRAPTRTLAKCHRDVMSAPTQAEARYAARILRKLAACKEPGGELRPLYLRVAALMEDEADAIAQVGTECTVYGCWRVRKNAGPEGEP